MIITAHYLNKSKFSLLIDNDDDYHIQIKR